MKQEWYSSTYKAKGTQNYSFDRRIKVPFVYSHAMEINIQIVVPEAYQILARIGRDTFYETWRSVNTEEDMQLYMNKAFDPAAILNDVKNPINTFYLAMANDEAVGYCKLRRDRTYPELKEDAVIELERIYVFKKHQDKKIGRKLMDICIELAKSEKMSWLWLGVNIDNKKAIDFYKSYGFTIFGEKAFKLGNAVDNDYLMKLDLR